MEMGSEVWGLKPFMDICPRCSLYKQLVLGLKITPPVCIDCAIDPTWINPQDNWGEEVVMLCQGNAFNGEIGPARVIVWHPKYSVIEQTGGDRQLMIVYWTGEKYLLPRGNGQALHTQMAHNTMPTVITQKEVNKMAFTTMEQKNSTQMEIERSSTPKDSLDATFQVELSKLKEEETQENKGFACRTSMTYRQGIASPLLRQLLRDSQDLPEVATPKGKKVIIDRAYNVATQEKQNHKNVEDPSIQKVADFYSTSVFCSDLPSPKSVLNFATTEKAKSSKKSIKETSTTTKHSKIDAEKPSMLAETDKLASVNMFSVKLPEFDTFKDFQDAIKIIMSTNKESASKSEARMHRGSTMGNSEKDGGPFVIEHHPKISHNLKFAFQDKTRTKVAPKETIAETAVAEHPENYSQIKAEMMQKVKEEHLTNHDTFNQTFNPSEQCLGDNYQTKISKEIPAKLEINKPRIQKAVSKQLTRILKKQKTRIERDVGDPALDGKVSVKKSGASMLLVKAIKDTGMTSKQGIQSKAKYYKMGPELKVKLFDIARLKEGVYRQEDNFGLAFKKQKTSKPNQNKPKIQNEEVVNGSSNDIGKTCKVMVHLWKQPMMKPVETEKESGLVLRNGRTLKNQFQTEQISKEATIPSRQGPGEKCKSSNQDIHHHIVARKSVIQNQERAKSNCMKHGKSRKEVQPLKIPQAPFTKSVAEDLPNFAAARNEEKPQKEDLRQTVVIAKDISTQTEGLAYRNSEESIDDTRNVIEKSKTPKIMLLSEIPQATKRLGKIPFKRAESPKTLPSQLIGFAKSQNAEKTQKEILDKAYNTMVSEVEISIQGEAGMLKIQNKESTVVKGIGKTQNAMLLSEMPQDPRIFGKPTNVSHIAMGNYADKPMKEGSRQRMMIAKQEIATHNERLVFSYGQKEKLQAMGETSTISRQEGPTEIKAKQPTIENQLYSSKKILDFAAYKELYMKDPRIRAKTLKGYHINEMTCMKSPQDKIPNLATTNQTKEQLEEGEIHELVQPVSLDIQIHVFGKDSQRINPNTRDVNICHWSQLWFETKPRKLNCEQTQSRDVARAEKWKRITSILAGCANPNLIFKSWRSHVGKDVMSKSVHVISFMLRNETLEISVYAHALGLWAYVKEPNLSGKYYREKYFIANVKHEMTDNFKIGWQDDGCERKGVKRSWEDVQPKSMKEGQAPYKKVCKRGQMHHEQRSIVFRRERHSSQNGRPVEVNPSCSHRKSYDGHW